MIPRNKHKDCVIYGSRLIKIIVPRLGLKIIFDYIIDVKGKILNKNVIREIEESVIEYGQHIDNPYWGM